MPRLQSIRGAKIIASNPCFELWYLLHYQEQRQELTSEKCNNLLSEHIKKYNKGSIASDLLEVLTINSDTAIKRAKELNPHKNPSTDIWQFIEELERVIK